jgi:autotransporter-associated beta strand protein
MRRYVSTCLAVVLGVGLLAGMAQAQVNIAPLGTAGNDGLGTWGGPDSKINDGVWSWSSTDGIHSDGGVPTRLWVTWTNDYVIDSVDLVHCEAGSGYCSKDYLIQALNAGGNPTVDGDWTTALTVVGNTAIFPSHSFAPVTTAGVRIYATDYGPSSGGLMRFEELLVYGELAPTGPFNFSALSASSVTTTSAVLQATLEVPETNATVYAHWWLDGGSTNSAYVGAWTNEASTNISVEATGLAAGTEYFYTFSGSNDTTNVLHDSSESFWTTAAPGKRSMKITFTNFSGRTTLNNFPLLVKLTAANTKNYGGFLDPTNGYDLRFYDNAGLGGTALNYEFESFDSSGESLIWVEVSALTHNGAIWASWGDDATQQASTTDGSTWNSGYKAVWHMGESDAMVEDATANDHDATAVSGLPSSTPAGRIGSANDFVDGESDYITIEDHDDFDIVGNFTISAWIYNHNNGDWEAIAGNHSPGWIFTLENSNDLRYYSNDSNWKNSGSIIPANQWTHVAITYEDGVPSSATDGQFYVNGVAVGSGHDLRDQACNTLMLGCGGPNWTGYRFDGLLDEIRISRATRSEDWLWASYMTQGTNHAAFLEYGEAIIPVIANSGASEVTSISATFNAALAAEGKSYDVYVHWGATDGGTDPSAWDHSLSVGSYTDVASTNISVWTNGFDWETGYFYSFQASNATENAWPPESSAFTTLEGPRSLYSMEISFTNFAGKGTLTDFPALVKLTTANTDSYSGFLDTTDGYDLRFYDNGFLDGTPLDYEIETFDDSGDSYIWVKVPTFTQNTSIWAAWGEDATQQASTTNGVVWDSDFKAVWHMGEATGLALDATANDHDATSKGGTPSSTSSGRIGPANDFVDAEGDYMMVPSNTHTDFRVVGQMTVSAWVYNHTHSGDEHIVGTYDRGFYMYLDGNDKLRYQNNSSGSTSDTEVPDNEWTHVAVVYDENNPTSTRDGAFYINGVAVGDLVDIREQNDADHLTIGAGGNDRRSGSYYFDGLIDEVRISRTARSAEWLYACSMNQGSHDAFVSYGAVQTGTEMRWTFGRTYDVETTAARVEGLINTNLTAATLVWATSDKGMDSTGDWTSSDSLGVQVAGPVSGQLTGLSADTQYSWRLYGVNGGTDAWSAETVFSSALSAAQKPVFTNAAPDEDSIRLYWTDNAMYETSYVLERSTNGSDYAELATLAADTEYYWDTGLAAGTYYYRLSAANSSNDSSTDSSLCATNAVCAGPDLFPANSGPNGLPCPPAGEINPATGLTWAYGDTYQLIFLTRDKTNLVGDFDIHYWNDHVNTVADGSSLAGVPDATWKVLGSSRLIDAKDNAPVTDPVFMLNGTSMIAADYADFWDTTLPECIDLDEEATEVVEGSWANRYVWMGTQSGGVKVSNRELDSLQTSTRARRFGLTNDWLNNSTDKAQTEDWRFWAVSMPLAITNGLGGDTTPPVPATMTWAVAPVGLETNTITMSATLAYDLESTPVEYFFSNTVSGVTRTWNTSRSWTETVAASSLQSYRVKARDAEGNETSWSTEMKATPLNKGPNGLWAPTGNHPLTGEPWQPGDTYQLTFITSTEPSVDGDQLLPYWDDYLNALTGSSSLPGMSNLNWFVMASSIDEDARDHAVVSAPVYLTDGATLAATGYTDMWDGEPSNPIVYDESGNYYSGETECWTGSNNDGRKKSNRELGNTLQTSVGKGHFPAGGGNWFNNGDRGHTETKRFYALSQLLGVVDLVNGDTSPPLPAPMTFSVSPRGLTATSVTMRATTAFDLENGPVEYLFTNDTTGASSAWQSSPEWVDVVVRGRVNTYRVKARDAIGNAGDWSAPVDGTPSLTAQGGVFAPVGTNPETGEVWQEGDTYHLFFLTSTETATSSDGDIAAWDAYVTGVADGSSLPGVSNVSWKAVCSTPAVQARDHAVASGPVYMMDGETLLAADNAALWSGSDREILLDESGQHYTLSGGESEAWTGSNGDGSRASNRDVGNPSQTSIRTGHFPAGSGHWFSNRDRGQTETKRFYAMSEPLTIAPTAVDVVNGAASSVTADAADLGGTVSAPLGQTLDVSAYWSTNDNADSAAWLADGSALSAVVGTYTDVVTQQISQAVGSLQGSTVYYYTFMGTNSDVTVWATPSAQFGTLGTPGVANVGSTPENGYATLTGDLLSTGGQTTTVKIYYGATDGETTPGNWDYNVTVTNDQSVGQFSADTTNDLVYGRQYYFRCQAGNVNGDVWADETVGFLTAMPILTLPVTANLEAWYDAGVGVTLSGSTVTEWQDQSGNGNHADSPVNTPELVADQINGLPGVKFRSEYLRIDHGMVPREEYIVFRSGRYDTDPNNPHLWENGWGGPFGQQNDNGWMLEDNQARTWNSRVALAMKQNGTSLVKTSNHYYFDQCGNYMVLKVNPLNYGSANAYIGRPNNSWYNGHVDVAEIIIFSDTKSEADENAIGGYLAAKYGIDTTYPTFSDPVSLVNEAVESGYTANEATFNATLRCDATIFDVSVYWGTNDGANVTGDWGHTNSIGSYTNVAVTNLQYDATGLTKDTRYYYAFMASNLGTNLWAQPSATFQTLGSLAVSNSVAQHVGYATITSEIPVGGQADATVVWGASDAGTNNGVNGWDNVVPMGNRLANAPFSTNTIDAWHGITYYTRTYVSNVTGEAWSDAIAFYIPKAMYGLNALMRTGYNGEGDDNEMDVDGNGGLMTLTPYGSAEFTSGPGDRGFDFNTDAEFRDDDVVSASDNYANLFLGYFTAQETGEFRFKAADRRNRLGLWLDLDRDGVFESSASGLGSDAGEQLAWEDSGEKLVDLEAGRVYRFAATTRNYEGDGRAQVQVRIPSVGYYYTVKPGDAAQAGLWKYDVETPLELLFENQLVSAISAGKATLNTKFKCEKASYDVWAYWSTTDGGTDAVSWEATGESEYVGSYTNLTSMTDIAHAVSNLLGAQTYYYTFRATNEYTDLWAEPSIDFVSAGPPTVSVNGGASAIDVGVATLNGNLTGGGGADAFICWGTSDGGTNGLGTWQNVITMGPQLEGLAFSNDISGTLYGVEYSYRVLASNGLGQAWSDLDTFWTQIPPGPAGDVPVTDNLEAWYDAGVGVDTSGNNVTKWADQSGNGNDTTSMSGTPELSTDEINGRPAIKFRSEHMSIGHAMVPREQYFVFRSGRHHSYPADPHKWGPGGWGGPFGQHNDNGWMLQDGQVYTWNSRVPLAMVQNGTPLTNVGRYDFTNVGDYFVLRVSPLNYTSANAYIGRPNNSWYNGYLDIAEIIIYSDEKSTADRNQIGGYLAYKYGITTAYSGFVPQRGVGAEPTSATDIQATTATLQGTLDATNSILTVTAFWSTNNNTNAVEWLADVDADSAAVGTYTNVDDHAISTPAGSLSGATVYYYTFRASTPQTNLWAAANASFETAGPPVAGLGGGATNEAIGTATLRGELTGGGAATAYICWGADDGGTSSTGNWANVDLIGSVVQGQVFSNAVSNVLFGLEYDYRVFVTNEVAGAFSAVGTFTTLVPVPYAGVPVTDGLELWFDASQITGLSDGQNLTQWLDESGNEHHTTALQGDPSYVASRAELNSKPSVYFDGNDGFSLGDLSGSFNTDAATWFIVTKMDNSGNPSTLYLTKSSDAYEVRGGSGSYLNAFRNGRADNKPIGYVANSQNSYLVAYESSTSNWEAWLDGVSQTTHSPSYQGGNLHSIAFRDSNNDRYLKGDIAELVIFNRTLTPDEHGEVGDYLADKYAITTTYTGYEPPQVIAIENSAASNIKSTTADLGGTLDATQSVFSVYAYWSTTSNETAAAWIADNTKGSALAGTYTNVMEQAVSGSATGLTSGTTYYYTMMATNVSTNIWATPTLSFATVGPPSVELGGGATDRDVGAVTLRGELTGGNSAEATFCWGAVDGDTNSVTDWEHSAVLGVVYEGAVFTNAISNLYYGVEYEYRVYVTNDAGHAWSAVTNFTTLTPLTTSLGVLNWDFETGDLSGWTIKSAPTGTDQLFRSGNQPNSGTRMSGKQGTWFIDGYQLAGGSGSDHHTGIIETDESFVLGANARWTFSSGGGNYTWSGTPAAPGNLAGIGLERESSPGTWENIVWQYGGNNTLVPRDHDLSAYEGDTVRIRVYDNTSGSYGFPGVDDITMSNVLVTSGATLAVINTAATNIKATAADLGGTLDADGSVFTVYAYYSTNSANSNATTWLADGDAVNVEIGTYTNVSDEPLTASVAGLTRGVTYTYTMMAASDVTNLWATPTATFTADGTPPEPDAMTFAIEPAAQDETTVLMVASTALDALNNPVQYYFENTNNSDNSGWVLSTVWTNVGLTEGVTYGYHVKARDAVSNETAYSEIFTATPAGDVIAPTPNPLTWVAPPAAIDNTTIVMTITNATDPNGPVTYQFENLTNATTSGWISGTTWTNTGLTSGTIYGYRVRAQDGIGNKTAWSSTLSSWCAPLRWDANAAVATQTDGAGNWLDASQWWNGTANVTWQNAYFNNAGIGSGGAGGTITLGDVTAGTVTFTNFSGTYTLDGGSLTVNNNLAVQSETVTINTPIGGGSVSRSGSGTLTLRGTNTYAGGTTLSGGIVDVTRDFHLGAADTAITFDGSATLRNNDGAANRTIDLGARPLALNNSAVGTIYLGRGDSFITTGAVTGDGGISVTCSGGNTDYLKLLNANNTFTGPITLHGGNCYLRVELNSLADSFSPITFNGGNVILYYVGDEAMTLNNRPLVLNASGAIENSSTHSLTINATTTIGGTGNKTLSLGGSGGGRLAGDISQGSSTLSIAKSGGTWSLSGANTYSGNTTINQGTLAILGSPALADDTKVHLKRSTTLSIRTDEAGAVSFGNEFEVGPIDTSSGVISHHSIDVRNNGGGTTGSTIMLGTVNLATGDMRANRQINIYGANDYILQVGDVRMSPALIGSATGGPNRFNPVSASLIITGTVQQVDGDTGSSAVDNNLYLGGTMSGNEVSGIIADADDFTTGSNANANAFNVYKGDTSEWTLSGTNTYTGTTTVNGGTLRVTGEIATGPVSISSGALGGTGSVGGAVTLSGSGGIDVRDGVVGTLALGSNLGISGAVDANDLSFDLGTGGGGTDAITVGGNVTMATSGAGVITLNQLSGTKIIAGTYDLIVATGSMPTVGNFTLATTAAFGNTFSIQVTGSTLQLVVAGAAAAPPVAFWDGSSDDNWSTVGNWSSNAAGTVAISGVPGYETDISLYATGAARLTSGTLDADFDVNSLTYVADATANTTIGGASQTLILESGSGITVNTPTSGTPTHTIAANVGMATNQTWSLGSGSALTISGVVGDFGAGNSLSKAGTGDLLLSGLNTYSGATVVEDGTLKIWHFSLGNSTVANALGMSSASTANLVLNPGTTLEFVISGDAAKPTDRGFTINGTANGDSVTLEAARSGGQGYRGVQLTSSACPGYGTPNQTRTLILTGDQSSGGGNYNNNTRLHANIADNGSGAVSLIKEGVGSWQLRGSCSFTGGSTINGGVLRMGRVNTLSSAGAVILADASGATFVLDNYSQVIGSLSGGGGSGGNVTLGTATLTAGDATSTTYAGVMSGTGSLVKQGAGKLTLSATHTYTGATTVNAGILEVTGSLAVGNEVGVVSGALAGTGTVNAVVTLSGTGGVNLQDAAVGTLTLASDLAIDGAVGANDLTFDLGNAAGGTDKITVGGNVTMTTSGAAVINLNQLGGTKIDVGTYDLIVASGTMETVDKFALATSSAFGNNFALQVTGSTLQVVVTSAASAPAVAFWDGSSDNNWSTAANWATNVAGDGPASGAPGYITDVSFYSTGAGRLTTGVLDADFDINSLTYIAGATADTVIGGSPNSLILEAGSGLTVKSPSSGTPTHTISANVGMATNQTWTVASDAALSVPGNIGDLGGGNDLAMEGTGTLTLEGTNTYSGATIVDSGTMIIGSIADGGAASAIGQSSAAAANLALGNGSTLRYNTGVAVGSTDRGFTIAGTSPGDSVTIESASVGAGSLRGISFTSTASPAYGAANQTRTLVLDGAFTASGVHNSYFNKLAANIADNGSGAVTVTKTGTGSWGLLGANTFTGGLNVEQGTLMLRAIAAPGAGVVTVGSAGNSATLDLSGGRRDIVGLATAGTAANQTITSAFPGGILNVVGATTSTFGGVISGSTASFTALTINNAGASLTLSGASTYTGVTTVDAGALLVNGSLAGSTVTVKSGGTLGGTGGTIGGPTTIQSGATLTPGAAGTGTLTFSGGLTLDGGATLSMQMGTASDQILVTGGTLSGPASGTVALNVTDAGGLGVGTYTVLDWTGAAGSVDATDFTLTSPFDSRARIYVQSSELILEIVETPGSLFKFR